MFPFKSKTRDSVMDRYRNSVYDSFNRPSFMEGLARIFDLGGTLRNEYDPPQNWYEADIAAMRSDWIVIGQDIGDAITAFSEQEETEALANE